MADELAPRTKSATTGGTFAMRALPPAVQSALPTVEQLEAELAATVEPTTPVVGSSPLTPARKKKGGGE